MGFCIAPFEWLSKSALSVSECRTLLFPWGQVKLGRGGTAVFSWLDTVWVCGKVWFPVFPKRQCAPHKKWVFSKTAGSFCKKFSTTLLQISENIFEEVAENSKFYFFTYFSPWHVHTQDPLTEFCPFDFCTMVFKRRSREYIFCEKRLKNLKRKVGKCATEVARLNKVSIQTCTQNRLKSAWVTLVRLVSWETFVRS